MTEPQQKSGISNTPAEKHSRSSRLDVVEKVNSFTSAAPAVSCQAQADDVKVRQPRKKGDACAQRVDILNEYEKNILNLELMSTHRLRWIIK